MTCKQVTKGLWLATSYIVPSNNKNKCNGDITNLSNTTNQFAQSFYPNVTTLYVRVFAVVYPSVACLSVVCCLSSVTLVHPTQVVEPFGNISSPLCTLSLIHI